MMKTSMNSTDLQMMMKMRAVMGASMNMGMTQILKYCWPTWWMNLISSLMKVMKRKGMILKKTQVAIIGGAVRMMIMKETRGKGKGGGAVDCQMSNRCELSISTSEDMVRRCSSCVASDSFILSISAQDREPNADHSMNNKVTQF
mmetsp:Transcript_37758/g.55696  ORF Transcript_37758/g.55696 Transcript_37758/m.55696 type:complete len:145 (-) Transcript_37758:7-441(-)